MKRSYITLSLIFLPLYFLAQFSYFNKLINLGYDDHYLPINIEIEQDTLYTTYLSTCNNKTACTVIIKINVNTGELIDTVLINNIINYYSNPLLVEKDRIILGINDILNGYKSIGVLFADKKLENINKKFFLRQNRRSFKGIGLFRFKSNYYVYGGLKETGYREVFGYIVKMDSTLNEVEDVWIYRQYGNIYDLQPTGDGKSLVFVVTPEGVGAHGNRIDDPVLVTISPEDGRVKDTIYPSLYTGSPPIVAMLATKEGKYIFQWARSGSREESYFGNFRCIDPVTHNKEWEIDMSFIEDPNDAYGSTVRSYTQARNGDIIATGEVINGVYESPARIGFIIRFSNTGKLKFYKQFFFKPTYYQQHNFNILQALFKDIEELPNGDLVVSGNLTQNYKPPIWVEHGLLFRVDSNGCYEGNCSDTIFITQQRTRNNLFLPGTRWYYDIVDIAIGLMRVDSYEVKDLVFDNYSEEYYDMGGWYM